MNHLQQAFSVRYTYSVFFTEGLFDLTNPNFSDFFPVEVSAPRKLYVILDSGVAQAHPTLSEAIRAYVAARCKGLQLVAEPLVVPGGEDAKNLDTWVDAIVEAVDRYGIDRHSYIAAIGGGSVLDMAGYAAAISHRGIRHIRIPTTVLSQNDSGVGVKNGINYRGKKNFLGTFAPPVAVFNDSRFLTTLDDRDWRSGIAEALKVALIKDASFFEWLEANAQAMAHRDMATMQQQIYRCAEMHLQHIAGGDPFEMGSSRPLDFGHWSAHKLEQLTDFRIRHGEAVAIGIALDTVYSNLLGWLSDSDTDRVLHTLHTLGFGLYVPELSNDGILKGLQEFREHLGGQLTIMLLQGIGRGVEVHEMDTGLIRKAIARLKTLNASVTA